MPRLPPRFASVILTFAPLFLQRSWRHAEMLLVGAILAPGRRTVASVLRITGLARERRFVNYHRVLNRAAWCPRAASHLLLGLLVAAFVPSGPVVLGIDDTIERRRGKRIAAPRPAPPAAASQTDRESDGIYRDPVRSSHGHFVKASGLRWLGLMLLAPVPWAERVWALPFLTVLAPSERYCQQRGRRHGGMPVVPIRWVLVRDPLDRFDPQALLCTDQACDPVQVLRWFVQRWQVEVTFREVRDHLGMETQRQWSDLAIARTTPCLLGLLSLVALLGRQLTPQARRAVATSAWYRKQRPTFSDTLATVRREIWREQGFVTSTQSADVRKLRPAFWDGIAYALCHAA